MAKRISGYSGVSVVTTTSPTSIEHHAVAHRAVRAAAFIRDQAEIGGAVALQRGDAAVAKLGPQRRRKRLGADQRVADRPDIDTLGGGAVDQDFQE